MDGRETGSDSALIEEKRGGALDEGSGMSSSSQRVAPGHDSIPLVAATTTSTGLYPIYTLITHFDPFDFDEYLSLSNFLFLWTRVVR